MTVESLDNPLTRLDTYLVEADQGLDAAWEAVQQVRNPNARDDASRRFLALACKALDHAAEVSGVPPKGAA